MKLKQGFLSLFTLCLLALSLPVSAATQPVAGSKLAHTSPYNLSHIIQVHTGNGNYKKSSATLIAPNLLLTVAHGVADDQTGLISDQTWSAEAIWGNEVASFNSASYITRTDSHNPFQVYAPYRGNWDAKNDVALIHISDPSRSTRNADTSQVGLRIYRNISKLHNKRFTVVSNLYSHPDRWIYDTGRITKVRPDGLLETNITAVHGQSGSAVVVDGKIIGVLSALDPSNSRALITPFTEDMRTTLFEPNGVYNIQVQ